MKNILIHTCCADCLLNAIHSLESRELINEESEITLYFYNPNIHPRSEYLERLEAIKKILPKIKEKYNAKLVIPNYSPKEYMNEITKGSMEFGVRCLKCWLIRLENSLKYAKENNIENITTTLLTSHYQERETIMNILNGLKKKYDINIVEIDETCNQKHGGFYKQNYCGCCFSLSEKMLESR